MFKKNFKRKLNIAAVLLTLTACLVLTMGKIKDDQKTEMVVSLLYENASYGLTPSGTRFDPYEVISEEVLHGAAEKTSLSEDILKGRLSVAYEGAKDRISTDITVKCTGDVNSSKIILDAVGKSYEEYLERTCCGDAEVFEDKTVEDEELLKKLDRQEMAVNQRATYMQELYAETKQYGEAKTLLRNIADTRLKSLRNLVIQEGLTKDKQYMNEVLTYRNMLLGRERREKMHQYDTRIRAIELYDATLFPTTSIPSIKGGEYYVSTTKTGLDDIYTGAKYILDEAIAVQKEITDNRYTQEQLVTETSNSNRQAAVREEESITENIRGANEMCQAIVQEENAKKLPFIKYCIKE